jgi:hypothetical protein
VTGQTIFACGGLTLYPEFRVAWFFRRVEVPVHRRGGIDELVEGKITLITGAKGGLGSFVTDAFLAEGARVGVSRSIQASDFPHAELYALPAELSSGESASRLVEEVVARFGRVEGSGRIVAVASRQAVEPGAAPRRVKIRREPALLDAG